MTILQTKYSSTASAVPTAAVLIQGELAVNVTDKRLFTEDNSGVVVELGTNPTSLTTGSIAVTGTVDGRDVATDGTKLDGIEAGANVTDTTNVTAAGALMDSEVTNLAQVKAFDSADYATAAQGTKVDGIEASADVTDTTNVVASLTAGANVTIAADGTISSSTGSDTTYTAGSGLSLTGTEFANTAPDQTVALTGAGATSISGTYPNFTITSTNTTYSVGDGGLTQINFTSADNTKLDGIAANANNYVLPFTNNSTNWNTAYGWGNHASAGYYAASNPNGYTNDQTAAEILTAIKTVDGTGSGLDADTVDGFNISTASTGTDANTIYFRT